MTWVHQCPDSFAFICVHLRLKPFLGSCQRLPGQRMSIALPIEIRAGIGLALRGNFSVPDDSLWRNAGIGGLQRTGYFDKRTVLCLFEWSIVGTFQLDTDREVIHARAPFQR